MTVGIVGLGLIGASMAKTVRKHTDFAILGFDANEKVVENARLDGVIDGVLDLTQDKCDILIVDLYPDDIVKFVKENAENHLWNFLLTANRNVLRRGLPLKI